jgi:ketosteroid isomerase-like protein
MSRENVELLLVMYEFFNRRDLDALLAFMHDEVEIEPRLGALEGDYRGHEGVRRWWSDLLDLLPDYRAEIVEVQDLGDMTLGHIRGRAWRCQQRARRRDVVAVDPVARRTVRPLAQLCDQG